MNGVMAFVELSPIRKAHCAMSGVIPICANIGMKMNDMKAHLEVAETIIRLMRAVNRMKRTRADSGAGSNEESRSAPMMARHLSRWEYSKQANICAAKKQ